MKGQLPKAYLRIDPNLDNHPDMEAMVLLLVWGNRQHPRGRFKGLHVLEKVLGKRRLRACLDRGDLKETESFIYVAGWDEWQEGDLTVGERMRRLRELRGRSRNGAVSRPSPNRITPSEASRRQGVKAEGTEKQPAPAVAVAVERPWNQRACELVQRRYGGTAPGGRITKAFRPLVLKHGEAAVLAAFERYLDETEAEYLSPERFATTYGHWAGTAARASPRSGPKQSVGEQALRAAAEFIGEKGGGG